MLEENPEVPPQNNSSPDQKSAGIASVIGALTSKAASYIPSTQTIFNDEIFNEVKTICANGGIEGQGPPIDSRVQDLVFCWSTDSKTDRFIIKF
jgi:hypothetical protein